MEARPAAPSRGAKRFAPGRPDPANSGQSCLHPLRPLWIRKQTLVSREPTYDSRPEGTPSEPNVQLDLSPNAGHRQNGALIRRAVQVEAASRASAGAGA